MSPKLFRQKISVHTGLVTLPCHSAGDKKPVKVRNGLALCEKLLARRKERPAVCLYVPFHARGYLIGIEPRLTLDDADCLIQSALMVGKQRIDAVV